MSVTLGKQNLPTKKTNRLYPKGEKTNQNQLRLVRKCGCHGGGAIV